MPVTVTYQEIVNLVEANVNGPNSYDIDYAINYLEARGTTIIGKPSNEQELCLDDGSDEEKD